MCGGQLRVGGLGTPFALDYGSVMMMGQAQSVDLEILAEIMPDAERAILAALSDSSGPMEE